MSQEQNDKAMAVPTAADEVAQLRAQLEAERERSAVGEFLTTASREFPSVPVSDLKGLVRDYLAFRDGQLHGTEKAMHHLRTRPFLQQPQQGSSATPISVNPADSNAHVKWQQQESRKAYLRTLFGRGANAKVANQLAQSDIAAYRRLRDEAIRLEVYAA